MRPITRAATTRTTSSTLGVIVTPSGHRPIAIYYGGPGQWVTDATITADNVITAGDRSVATTLTPYAGSYPIGAVDVSSYVFDGAGSGTDLSGTFTITGATGDPAAAANPSMGAIGADGAFERGAFAYWVAGDQDWFFDVGALHPAADYYLYVQFSGNDLFDDPFYYAGGGTWSTDKSHAVRLHTGADPLDLGAIDLSGSTFSHP